MSMSDLIRPTIIKIETIVIFMNIKQLFNIYIYIYIYQNIISKLVVNYDIFFIDGKT